MIHKYENEEEKGKAVQDHVHVYCEAAGDVETCMKAIPKAYIMSMRRGVALLDLYIACAWRVTMLWALKNLRRLSLLHHTQPTSFCKPFYKVRNV